MGFGERLSNAAKGASQGLGTAIEVRAREDQDIRQSKFAKELEDLRNIQENGRQNAGFTHAEKLASERVTAETGQLAAKAVIDRQTLEAEQLFKQNVEIPGQISVAMAYNEGRTPAVPKQSDQSKRDDKVVDDALKSLNEDGGDDTMPAKLARQILARTNGSEEAVVKFFVASGMDAGAARAEARSLRSSVLGGPAADTPTAETEGAAGVVPSAPASSTTPPAVQSVNPPAVGPSGRAEEPVAPVGDATTAEGVRASKQAAMFGKTSDAGNKPVAPSVSDVESLDPKKRSKYESALKQSMNLLAEAKANPARGTSKKPNEEGEIWAVNRARGIVGLPPMSAREYDLLQRLAARDSTSNLG